MEILVCVKRVPATGGRIVLTADGQEIDTRYLGFTVSPHEECAVEEAVRIVEAQGGSSTVLTLGPAAAEEQLRDAMAVGDRPGDPARDRRPRVRPDRHRGGDRRDDPRAGGGARSVRPDPVRQRGGRHRRLPGRDPGRRRARPADRHRHQVAGRPRRGGVRAARGDRRRLGDLRGPAAGGRVGQGGAQPAALPVRAGAAAGEAQGGRAGRAGLVASTGRRSSACGCPRRRAPRSRSWATDPTRRRPWWTCWSGSACSPHERRPRLRRARGRRGRPAVARGPGPGGRAGGGDRRRRRGGPVRRRRGGRRRRALGAHGVATVHVVDDPRLEAYAPAAWGAAIVELVAARSPAAVIAGGSDRGHEVLAHVAARTGRPLVANVVEVGRRRAVAADPPALGRQPARGRRARRPTSRC